MKEQKQMGTFLALLLGLCWPGASLLCLGKTRQALTVGFLLVFYGFFLAFMPVRFIILTLYLYIFVFVLCLFYGLFTGLAESRKPRKDIVLQDKAPHIFLYLVFLLCTVFFLSHLPVSFFTVKQQTASVNQNDLLVIQEKIPLAAHHFDDTVIFYGDDFSEHLGTVKAIAGDILEFDNNTLFRNGKELAKLKDFPIKKMIVPENLILIQHDKLKIHSDNTDNPNETFETSETQTLTFLSGHRIKGKALFILFSRNFKSIGKRLVFATVAK